MGQSEEEWLDHGLIVNGWGPPAVAGSFWRLPIVRHVRAFWHGWRTERHYARWASVGSVLRSGYDEWVLYGIWKGWV